MKNNIFAIVGMLLSICAVLVMGYGFYVGITDSGFSGIYVFLSIPMFVVAGILNIISIFKTKFKFIKYGLILNIIQLLIIIFIIWSNRG